MEGVDENASDAASPGWDAITGALAGLYPDQEPRHFGPVIRYRLGGPDPLDGFSAWKRLEPVPHWHIVTYGFSELYEKESDDPEVSGFGFELTFRPTCDPAEEEPPMWALDFLQNLARYVFDTGNVFKDGDWMPINGPITRDRETALRSIAFAEDPELPALSTPSGTVAFLQVVGLTEDEEGAAKLWKTARLLDVFRARLPLLVSDLDRDSLLTDPDVRRTVEEGSARDGSSTGYLLTELLSWKRRRRLLGGPVYEVMVGSQQVEELTRLLPRRLPFGRSLRLAGDSGEQILFEPGEQDEIAEAEGALAVRLTPATATALSATLLARAGDYAVPGLPVTWRVRQTTIGP
ncbi:suppressor of fused domain protein [Allosphingosinicella deserti]|uniref:Aminotransferase n=1 Tax=Allosphingosinicella deserti TaxID=2116704 RepID=A0A2P7QNS3_9SPHN|nr:suppressor of fused domain protein [Sphingomonas deserti]PSJ39617.1 aminotransferase [Sphingomonas deserti]